MAQQVEHYVRSFAGGEFAPELQARGDLAKYSTAVAKCENFIPRVTGSAEKRPGFEYLWGSPRPGAFYGHGFPAYKTNTPIGSRLIPFQFNMAEAYTLVFAPRGVRETGDIYAVGPFAGPDPVATHPYSVDELRDLDYAQSGDLVYLTHSSHSPKILKRTTEGTGWDLSDVVFGAAMEAPEFLSPYSPGSRWCITAVSASGEESLRSEQRQHTAGNLLRWTIVEGAASYNIYKGPPDGDGSSEAFGWFAEVGVPDEDAVDVRFRIPEEPVGKADTTKGPPTRNTNPFEIAPDEYAYPSLCTFFQQRLVYARSDEYPQTVWGSRVGSYDNFNLSRPIADDDTFEWALSSTTINEVTGLVPMQDLIVLTSGGEWRMSASGGGGSITPTSVQALRQSQIGASPIKPLVIGSSVLFAERDRQTVRDLEYSFESDSYTGGNLTLFASHLFDGHHIVRWAYQRRPYFCVWVVRDDGALLGMTYDKDQKVTGWHRHTVAGRVLDVSVVLRDGQDDLLTLLVATRHSDYTYLFPTLDDEEEGMLVKDVTELDLTHTPHGLINQRGLMAGDGEYLRFEGAVPAPSGMGATYPAGDVSLMLHCGYLSIGGDSPVMTFRAKLYKRDALGVDTLVCELSDVTLDVQWPYLGDWHDPEIPLPGYEITGAMERTTLQPSDTFVLKIYVQATGEPGLSYVAILSSEMNPTRLWLPLPEGAPDLDRGLMLMSQGARGITDPRDANLLDMLVTKDSPLSHYEYILDLRVSAIADGSVVHDIQVHPVVVDEELTGYTLEASTPEDQHMIDNAVMLSLGMPYTATLESLSLEPSVQQTVAQRYKSIKQMYVKLLDSRHFKYGPVDGGEMYEAKFRTTEGYGDPTELFTGGMLLNPVSGGPREAKFKIISDEPMPLNIIGIDTIVEVGDM